MSTCGTDPEHPGILPAALEQLGALRNLFKFHRVDTKMSVGASEPLGFSMDTIVWCSRTAWSAPEPQVGSRHKAPSWCSRTCWTSIEISHRALQNTSGCSRTSQGSSLLTQKPQHCSGSWWNTQQFNANVLFGAPERLGMLQNFPGPLSVDGEIQLLLQNFLGRSRTFQGSSVLTKTVSLGALEPLGVL